MPTPRSDYTVPTILAMQDLHIDELSDGAQIWCTSPGQMFTFVQNSSATTDGVTIFRSSQMPSSASRFILNAVVNGLLTGSIASTMFIDPVNGNDFNTGASSSAALQTHEELMRRIAGATLNSALTVSFLNDMPVGNPIWIRGFDLGSAAKLIYNSPSTNWTTLYTGSVTAVTGITRSTNTAMQITDAAIPTSWTAAGLMNAAQVRVKRFRITSGPRAGAIGYPLKDLGANTARFSNIAIVTPNVSGVVTQLNQVTPQVGDAFVIETMVGIEDFSVNLPNCSAVGRRGFNYLMCQDLAFAPNDSRRGRLFIGSGDGLPSILFTGCSLSAFDPAPPVNAGGFQSGVNLGGGIQFLQCFSAVGLFSSQVGLTAIVGGGSVQPISVCPGGVMYLDGDFVVSGSRIQVGDNGVLLHGTFAVFDSASPFAGVTVNPGATLDNSPASTVIANPIWGSNNNGFGITVRSGGQHTYQNVSSITGTTNDTQVGGTQKAWGAIPYVETANNAMIVLRV